MCPAISKNMSCVNISNEILVLVIIFIEVILFQFVNKSSNEDLMESVSERSRK